MHVGRIVETGPTAEVLSRPRHPHTRELLAAFDWLGAPGDPQPAAVGEGHVGGPGEAGQAGSGSLQATVTAQIFEVQRAVEATLVFITHDLALARQVADRIVVLEEGRIVEDGPTDQILTDPAQEETQVLLAAFCWPRPEQPTRPSDRPPPL